MSFVDIFGDLDVFYVFFFVEILFKSRVILGKINKWFLSSFLFDSGLNMFDFDEI